MGVTRDETETLRREEEAADEAASIWFSAEHQAFTRYLSDQLSTKTPGAGALFEAVLLCGQRTLERLFPRYAGHVWWSCAGFLMSGRASNNVRVMNREGETVVQVVTDERCCELNGRIEHDPTFQEVGAARHGATPPLGEAHHRGYRQN